MTGCLCKYKSPCMREETIEHIRFVYQRVDKNQQRLGVWNYKFHSKPSTKTQSSSLQVSLGVSLYRPQI